MLCPLLCSGVERNIPQNSDALAELREGAGGRVSPKPVRRTAGRLGAIPAEATGWQPRPGPGSGQPLPRKQPWRAAPIFRRQGIPRLQSLFRNGWNGCFIKPYIFHLSFNLFVFFFLLAHCFLFSVLSQSL